jgi:hypothetical protein
MPTFERNLLYFMFNKYFNHLTEDEIEALLTILVEIENNHTKED